MIKTILVPISGSGTDHAVFETALAVARTTQAHMQFYHVRQSAGEAMLRKPHANLSIGSAIPAALTHLDDEAQGLSVTAAQRARDFCATHGIPEVDPPRAVGEVCASFTEATDHAVDRLLQHARHSDLVVWGRRQHQDYMPAAVVEDLLMHSGRPVLLAARRPAHHITETMVVGWNETPQSAHALSAALPLLIRAERVVLVSVAEAAPRADAALSHLSSHLAWHGIAPQHCVIEDHASKASLRIQKKALELKAQLLVLGGFGHRPAREYMLGGVTRNFLEHGSCPVLFAH